MKKTTKAKKRKVKSEDFDMNKDNEYQAEFSLGPNAVQYLEFKLDKAECGNLTYDEVESKAYDKAEKLWPTDSFPNLELKQIRIHCTDTDEWCDVYAESMKDKIKECEKNSKQSRFLVLSDAVYSITPECKLWLTLKAQGVISENEEFDAKKMKIILDTINAESK